MGLGNGSYYIDDIGDLYGFGINNYGNMGLGHTNDVMTPTKLPLSGAKQVVIGGGSTYVLLQNGDLYSAGYNHYNNLGDTRNVRTSKPNATFQRVMTGVRQIASGYYHTMALKYNGDLWGCGYNQYGQVGTSMNYNSDVGVGWALVRSNVKQVDCGGYTTFIVDINGNLYGLGFNATTNYALGIGSTITSTYVWQLVFTNVAKVYAGGNYFGYALRANGDLYSWGLGSYYQTGFTSTSVKQLPTLVMGNVKDVYVGFYAAIIHTSSDVLIGCGYNNYGELALTPNSSNGIARTTITHINGSDLRNVGRGSNHTLWLMNNGSIYTTGYDFRGQLGTGSNSNGAVATPYLAVSSGAASVVNGSVGDSIVFSADSSATSPIHKQDTVIKSTIASIDGTQVRYKLLVNGVQVFPAGDGWTEFVLSPFQLTKSLSAEMFNIGNNSVTLAVSDSQGASTSLSFNVSKTSVAPTITDTVAQQIHKENLTVVSTVADSEGDFIQYRVFLNNVQMYPESGWTELQMPPITFSTVLLNSLFNMGANTVKIEARDEFGVQSSVQRTVLKTNAVPVITMEVLGSTLKFRIQDPEGDTVRYRILLNGEQLFPGSGMTAYGTSPAVSEYKFPSDRIRLKQNNTAQIFTEDDMGGANSRSLVFVGDYAGLMFCDVDETYYSTDIGEVLRYLDFGTVVAGGSTPTARVWLKNTLGFDVKNVRLWTNQGDLDGVNAVVQLSKQDSPFIPEDEVLFPEVVPYGSKISFYVRVVTNRQALIGGMFDIITKADPL
jgi:alpha-tubulin suppressor-like RCC1 family protein